MTPKREPDRRFCVRCKRVVTIAHEHSTRLVEAPEPPRLEPGWSRLDEGEIEIRLSDYRRIP